MKKGSIVVLYTDDDPRKYCVFERSEGWSGYELLKGGIEDNETPEQTAKREVWEEAGLKIDDVKKSDNIHTFTINKDGEDVKYVYHVFYACIPSDSEIRLSHEHNSVSFLEKQKAVGTLSFDDLRNILKKVDKEIVNDN